MRSPFSKIVTSEICDPNFAGARSRERLVDYFSRDVVTENDYLIPSLQGRSTRTRLNTVKMWRSSLLFRYWNYGRALAKDSKLDRDLNQFLRVQ